MADQVETVIERIVAWAAPRHDVRALAVIGSRARHDDHPADRWSDVDLLFTTTRPSRYRGDGPWIDALGRPWLTYVERTPAGAAPERRFVLDDAVEVDLVILSSRTLALAAGVLALIRRTPAAARLVPRTVARRLAAASDVVRRGMRVLIDRDGTLVRLRASAPPTPGDPPSATMFLDVVHRFWHGPIWLAKHVQRGELWRVKTIAEPAAYGVLLTMLEWHARSRHGWDHDVWDRGRFLEEWADPRAVAALHDVFGRYDTSDVWASLFATMDLFRWLATETAVRLGYPYPADLDRNVTDWVTRCRS